MISAGSTKPLRQLLKTASLARCFFYCHWAPLIALPARNSWAALTTHSTLKCILLAWVITLSACADSPPQPLTTYAGATMGTSYRVVVNAAPAAATAGLAPEIEAALAVINNSMSTYLPDSEVSQFNRSAALAQQPVTPPLLEVLQIAAEISEFTGGAFDITVAPLVRIWGFDNQGQISVVPDAEVLRAITAAVGYQHLSLHGNALSKDQATTEINLSAIAKGFAIDQLARLLDARGVENYLVEIGGELKAKGVNQQQRPWQVAIESPLLGGGIHKVIPLTNLAIATSGDYRNFVVLDGKSYSHTIDPQTGRPVYHQLASATVLHPSATHADALATALMVMGDQHAFNFAQQQGLAAYLLIKGINEGEFTVLKTDEFERLAE